jgi:type III secretory pathway component EscU
MWEEVLKALTVYLWSMVKFFFGPIGGKAAGLHIITAMIVTVAGMMTVVVMFTYFGEFIRKRILDHIFKKKTENKPLKMKSNYLTKYGLVGVALLTPILLSPIGGTLIAVGISTNRVKIILYMFISACVWSVIITCGVYFGYDAVMFYIRKVQPV